MVRFYLEKVISQFTPVYGLYRKFCETLFAVNEIGLFRMLIDVTAEETGTAYEILCQHLKANEYVLTPFLHDQEVWQ